MPKPKPARRLRVSDLSENTETRFEITPDAAQCGDIARELGLDGLRKLRFAGHIVADGTRDWRLEADLGATVIQPCVVTLAPVTTRIEDRVVRRFLTQLPEDGSEEEEIELPEDETIERLGREIDLDLVLFEALALALPLYPRAPDATLEKAQFSEPGQTPMSDDDARPFAGLKALRNKLENDD
jgi:uncharacterized metal-binding protein YceD (DUF177 family)